MFPHPNPPPHPQASSGRRIYVGNLPYTINDGIIRELFAGFGGIMHVDMPIDPAYVVVRGAMTMLVATDPTVLRARLVLWGRSP